MTEELIAPCGMNCELCIAYQFEKKDLNRYGFHRTYCSGCIPRGENCTHMGNKCELLGKGIVRFCFDCDDYPCKMLKSLDKRYRTKYHMSMIENLEHIRTKGMEDFLKKENAKWTCEVCKDTICCHNGLCLEHDIDKLLRNRKYRWEEDKE